MADLLYLRNTVWALTTILELLLLGLLVRKKAIANYPFFTAYLISAILQSLAVATVYRTMEIGGRRAWFAAWGTQAVVTIMRSLALVELAKRVLSAYAGIWGLARRLLTVVGRECWSTTCCFRKGNGIG